MRVRSPWVKVLVVGVTAVAAASACGTDDPSSAGNAADLTGARAGQTITISYTNNEGAAFSLPEFRIGGETAVEYLNSHGGIDGAKIVVQKCLADASPESSINCANKAVEAKAAVAVTGIDVASDAALPVLSAAGVPYVTSNSWGTAQNTNANAFILGTGPDAYAIAPLQTLKSLGATKVAVMLEDTPAGRDFVKSVVPLIGHKLGLTMTPVLVSPTNPDWAAAVTTAMASHPDGIFGQLTEPGCIGMVTATSTLGFKGPVMAGSCTAYIKVLGAKAVGTYISSDVFMPENRADAPPNIQANLDIYSAAMKAAGQDKYINGYAAASFSAMMELAAVLKTIPAGTPIDAAAVKAALTAVTDSPGFLGTNLHCAQHPWPSLPSTCRADILVFKVAAGADGTVVKQLVGSGFQDFSALVR